jgi:hypothetical protein
MQSGNQEISEGVVEVLKTFRTHLSNLPIDVIIDSPGGEMRASFLATLVFQSCCDYVAVVPRFAKSGATLFSLGSSEIIFGRWAELGPLDPQIESFQIERRYFRQSESALEGFHASRYAQEEVLRHLDSYVDFFIKIGLSSKSTMQEAVRLAEATIGKVYSNVSPFELGSAGRMLDVMQKYCLRIMQKSYKAKSEAQRAKIAKSLVWDYPTHDYYIDFNEATQIGLLASEAPDNIQMLLDELAAHYGKTPCLGVALPIAVPPVVAPNAAVVTTGGSVAQQATQVPATTTGDGNGKK